MMGAKERRGDRRRFRARRFAVSFAAAVFAMAVAFSLAGCSGRAARGFGVADDGRLRVAASFYPMYDFASKVGGDRAQVVNLVPSGTEPHDWEPSPEDIVTLERADVFVYSGAGMEHWAEDVVGGLDNQELTVVTASEGIALLEDGGQADPHVWLDPLRAKQEMENIAAAFAAADPENAAYYEENCERWGEEFLRLDEEFRSGLSGGADRELVTAHEAYGYLCAAYGLKQVGIDGLSSDSEPDPARMARIIDLVREKGIRVIFFEELGSSKVADAVARETGTQAWVLNPLEGLSREEEAAGDDYFSVMRANLEKLKEAGL